MNCAAETSTYTSKKVNNGISAFDINLRSTYASLSFGREGLAKFCGIMDLPPPVLMDSYNKLSKKLGEEYQKIAESSMKDAAIRLIDLTMVENPENIDVLQDGIVLANVAVSIDGTWQKRGHASKHGVVFVISVQTGEVLDCSVKTLYCHQCQIYQNDYKNSEKYKAWYQEHSPHCTTNFEGSSGAMECEAGVEMWLRSIEKNILRYTTFVGDGDSSCFCRVKEACFQKYPDGSYPVNKEECVGHTQKRMGSGLREYKKRMRGQKLPDGKNVGGAGRLTDAVIDRIQSNYGEAIRNNSEIGTMKTAISGVYHHMIKDEKMTLVQQHKYCPMNTVP